jgi:hypothetical protein
MNKTLKKFAIAITVIGATVTATKALATDTNTFTNAIQSVSINLTVYSNSPFKSTTSQEGGRSIPITTKTILAALSNASPNIPALAGFDFGRSPQLVYLTTFAATNVPLYTTNQAVITNTVPALSTTNAETVFFNSNALSGSSLTISTNLSTTNFTGGYAVITNVSVGTNGSTNTVTAFNGWATSSGIVQTNDVSYTGTNGATDTLGATLGTNGAFPTNVGVWTVVTAATNSLGQTNVTFATFTNVPAGTATNYVTNEVGLAVQGGTAASPTFAYVGGFVGESGVSSAAVITATGTNIEVPTNDFIATETWDQIRSYSINVFGLTGTGTDNLDLDLQGFAKSMFKYDVLKTVIHHYTNEVMETTSTAAVTGFGLIGGTYITNTVGSTNSVSVGAFNGSEVTGIGSVTNTNSITGTITNYIPVVVEGTITVGAPRSVAQ